MTSCSRYALGRSSSSAISVRLAGPVPNRRASWAMRRTPYSPFVEKDTAPVLWYVRVASLVLRFSGIVRRSVFDRPDRLDGGWVAPPRSVRCGARGTPSQAFGLALTEPSVRPEPNPRLALAGAAIYDGRSDSGGCRHSGFHPIPTNPIGYEYRQPAGCVNVGWGSDSPGSGITPTDREYDRTPGPRTWSNAW